MGGSGGGGFLRGQDPEKISGWMDRATRNTDDAEYVSTINGALQEILASYNDRDIELVRDRIQEIAESIEDELDTFIDTRFGGSVQKKTYVEGFSDVDALFILRDKDLERLSPQELMKDFASVIESNTDFSAEIVEGNMAVTVEYDDGMELQILPTLARPNGLRIPNPDGTGWSPTIRPQDFASKLTDSNQQLNGRLVPTIKLAKGALHESKLVS